MNKKITQFFLFLLPILGLMGGIVFIFLQSGAAFSEEEQKFIYQDEGKRDPFVALIDKDGNFAFYDDDLVLSDLVLEGVVMGANSATSVAIVNGKIFKINDKIGPFVLVEIKNEEITVKRNEKNFKIKLKREE